jgi:septation ring formation regulator EzrA
MGENMATNGQNQKLVKEKISLMQAVIRHYEEQINGGFAQQKKLYESEISHLQDELEKLKQKELAAPETLIRYKKQLKELENSVKQNEVSPLVNRMKKVASQLKQLMGELDACGISTEDMEELKKLINPE